LKDSGKNKNGVNGRCFAEKSDFRNGKSRRTAGILEIFEFYRYYTIIHGGWESDFHEKSHQKNGCFEVVFCGKIFGET
jgi:hypothetical protein